MAIMTIGTSPAEVNAKNNGNLQQGIANLGNVYANPGLMMSAGMHRAQMQQIQQRLALQQQYQNELAQSFVQNPDGSTTIDPTHWARANATRLAMDPNADPVQGMMAVRGQIPETNAKGGAFAALPADQQAAVVGPQPIKVAPGNTVIFPPNSIMNPNNHGAAKSQGAAPATGGIMGASSSTAPSQTGAGAASQTPGANPNVYGGIGKIDPASLTTKYSQLRDIIAGLNQEQGMIQQNPDSLGGILHNMGGLGQGIGAHILPALGYQGFDNTTQQMNASLGRSTADTIHELAGVRGGSSKAAAEMESAFNIQPFGNPLMGHFADNSSTASNKLAAADTEARTEGSALRQQLVQNGYEDPGELPGRVKGVNYSVPLSAIFNSLQTNPGAALAPTSALIGLSGPGNAQVPTQSPAASVQPDPGNPQSMATWLSQNPTDPRASKVQAKLAAMGVIPQPIVPQIPDQSQPVAPAASDDTNNQ